MQRNLIPATIVILGSLAGCASSPVMITSREDGLIKSGFQKMPANTAARQVMMKQLTPYVTSEIPNGKALLYAYSDPKICQCLYVGSPEAWSKYQEKRAAEHIADRQTKADPLIATATWDWKDWGFTSPNVSSPI